MWIIFAVITILFIDKLKLWMGIFIAKGLEFLAFLFLLGWTTAYVGFEGFSLSYMILINLSIIFISVF